MNELVSRLAALDTCAVSDALDKLGLPGTVLGILPLTVTRRVAGRVRTMQLVPFGEAPPTKSHLGTAAIESAKEGDVIVVANGGRVEMASWGGNLSRAARVKGVRAVIVDGACRDIDEARHIDFPLFGRTGVPLTARGRVVEASHGEPVQIGHVTVRPDDLVLADSSGVVFVDQERAAEIIETAEEIARIEAQMAARIEAGDPVGEVMGATYETMLKPGGARS